MSGLLGGVCSVWCRKGMGSVWCLRGYVVSVVLGGRKCLVSEGLVVSGVGTGRI